MTKDAKTKAKATKKCSMPRCRNDAASHRAKFCTGCFKKNASAASLKRKVYGGNSSAKGKGFFGNSGNSSAKGVFGNSGNTSAKGKGVFGNSGNTTTGQKKKLASERSALRRSTKKVLVVKEPWVGMILDGEKTWEIRGSATAKRGKIHLAASRGGGVLVGQCQLVDCYPVIRSELVKNVTKHCIKDLACLPYKMPHAWVLAKAKRYSSPFTYKHPQGAITWVAL